MIMTTNEFNRIKQEVLDRPICYREVEAKEIVALGENHYTVGNATLEVEPQIAAVIDRFAGIKQGQSRIAQDSYGEQGLTNLRNFFGQAEVKGSKRLVLAADILHRQIVNAIPIKERMITPDVFFDFAEMFMDKNSYLPERVEYTHTMKNGVSILMKPVHKQIREYVPGDEFLSNGLYLTWNPGEINLGNYYVRLVCSNGNIQTSHHAITKAHSPEVKELERLLMVTADAEPLKQNMDKMLVSAKLAMRTTASVRELGIAVKLLNQHGVETKDANRIIPYEVTKEQYEQAGYNTDSTHMTQAKSEMTMWELFNMLTFFATHNQMWSPQDIRRSLLMEASMVMLMQERDIKEYYNIF